MNPILGEQIAKQVWCGETGTPLFQNSGPCGYCSRSPQCRSENRPGFFRAVVLPLAMVVVASACGGGGGAAGGGAAGGESTQTVNTPSSQVNFMERVSTISARYRSDAEFSNQWGLGRIRADQAYAHVELAFGSGTRPGEGVTIGFVDSGIDEEHPAFAGSKDQILVEQFLPGTGNEMGSNFVWSHGTAVASVAAGKRNAGLPNSTHGVAEGADLAMFAAPLSRALPLIYTPTVLSALSVQDKEGIERWFSWPLRWGEANGGLDILNLSFAFYGLIENYSETEIRTHLGDLIETMAQVGAPEKTILVWAAANYHGRMCFPGSSGSECMGTGANGQVDATSVSLLAGLPTRIAELRGHVIAVVSVGEDGTIVDTSNRCGIAGDWCLAAPGGDVTAAHFGRGDVRDFRRFSGTSFAAPMVSGGLALMKQLFRNQLSNTDLVTRLFATANKLGRYSDRSIYGQGLLDLGTATTPVGRTSIQVSGDRVGDPGVNLQVSNIMLGRALGDGLTQSLTGGEIAAFDALGAPFWFDLGHFAMAGKRPSMRRQLRDFMAMAPTPRGGRLGPDRISTPPRFRIGLLETPGGTEGGHLALAKHANTLTMTGKSGWSATAFSTEGISWQAPTRGATLSWRPAEAPMGWRVGWLAEQKGLLGSSVKGAFGGWSSDSGFIGIQADGVFDGWQLNADLEMGLAVAEPRGGLITDTSLLTTSAFALHAMRLLSGSESLGFSISQPLRVESGRATLSVPVGRTKDGDVLRQSLMADVVPTGRQIDVATHWRQSLDGAGELRLGFIWTRQPGHRAAADSDFSLLAAWRLGFL